MKEQVFKINDVVNAIIPGLNPEGVTIKIDDMQKWSDGVMHYGGQHKTIGTGTIAYNRGVQFIGEQATLIPAKADTKVGTKVDSKVDSKEKLNIEPKVESKNTTAPLV